ncbi:MAG: PIG-L family deacetylase [Fimbriimonadaceae bacterium]|nr:PIG-L family deacetylase [Fimbriimonadaceae bacterium]
MIAVWVIAGLLLLFYLWQPNRIDLVQKRPKAPLPRMPIADTGLLSKTSRVLVITGHPDDEAYYVGGTLFALKDAKASVKLIALTNGDKGYYFFSDSKALTKVRQAELRESCEKVGAEVDFYNEPDGRLPVSDEIIDRVAVAIQAYRPTHILCFDPDYPPRISHGDHRAAAEIARDAAKKAEYNGWMMHFSTMGSNTAVDVSVFWSQAEELLAIHKSQFFGEKLERIRNTVSNNALNAGEQWGVAYAEPFRAVKLDIGK